MILNWSKARPPAWWARLVGRRGAHPRVEIRHTVPFTARDASVPGGWRDYAVPVLITVSATGVQVSAKAALRFTPADWLALVQAVAEAQVALASPPTLALEG